MQAMERYLYFRAVADEDNDDGDGASSSINPTSICIPASRIVGIAPSSDALITIWFKSVKNAYTQGDAEEVLKDSIALSVTTHRHKAAISEIIRAINGGPHSDGFIVVADDVTTNYANATVAAQYIHPDITGIADDGMNVFAANS